jgi:hypothetical protein
MSDGFPIGAIIAFPGASGPPSNQYWALCNGASQSITGAYGQLFEAIGYANGGSSESGMFNLPDYRGRFMRGTDNGAGNDPDASSRTAMNPGGNPRDAVGSIQAGATGPPFSKFIASFPHLPDSSRDIAATAVGYTVAAWDSGSEDVSLTGGDDETRPINAYVLFYIKYSAGAQ